MRQYVAMKLHITIVLDIFYDVILNIIRDIMVYLVNSLKETINLANKKGWKCMHFRGAIAKLNLDFKGDIFNVFERSV